MFVDQDETRVMMLMGGVVQGKEQKEMKCSGCCRLIMNTKNTMSGGCVHR
jgi:hypothetical protein